MAKYTCSECNYNTDIKSNYERHMKSSTHYNRLNIYPHIMHKDNLYVCKKCLASYKNERHCFTHIKQCDVKRIISANTSPSIPIHRELNNPRRYLYHEFNISSKLFIIKNQLSNKLSYINKLIDRSKTIQNLCSPWVPPKPTSKPRMGPLAKNKTIHNVSENPHNIGNNIGNNSGATTPNNNELKTQDNTTTNI